MEGYKMSTPVVLWLDWGQPPEQVSEPCLVEARGPRGGLRQRQVDTDYGVWHCKFEGRQIPKAAHSPEGRQILLMHAASTPCTGKGLSWRLTASMLALQTCDNVGPRVKGLDTNNCHALRRHGLQQGRHAWTDAQV